MNTNAVSSTATTTVPRVFDPPRRGSSGALIQAVEERIAGSAGKGACSGFAGASGTSVGSAGNLKEARVGNVAGGA